MDQDKKHGPTKLREVDLAALPLEPGIPALWVDAIEVNVRSDIQVASLQCYLILPDRKIEVSRLQVSVSHLLQMGNVFQRVAAAAQQEAESEAESNGEPSDE